jgi:integrase
VPLFKQENTKNWIWRKTINGKVSVRSTHTQNRSLAEKIARQYEQEILKAQLLGEKEPILFEAALEQLEDARQHTKGFHTTQVHTAILRQHFNTRVFLHDLKDKDLNRFVHKRRTDKKSENTIRLSLSTLRQTLKVADDLGYKTPQLNFPVTKPKRHRIRFLTQDEEQALLKELSPERVKGDGKRIGGGARNRQQDLYDLVVLLLDTGARHGEITALPWSAIDLEAETITLYRSKVENESTLYMTSRVKAILTRRHQSRGKNQYVFQGQDGNPRRYQTDGITAAITRADINTPQRVRETGEKITIHNLRHTAASRLIGAGMSLYEVGRILGHTDPATTAKYSHLVEHDVSKKAARILNSLNGHPQ